MKREDLSPRTSLRHRGPVGWYSLSPSQLPPLPPFLVKNKSADPSTVWKPVPSAVFSPGSVLGSAAVSPQQMTHPTKGLRTLPGPFPNLLHKISTCCNLESCWGVGRVYMAWNPLKQDSKPRTRTRTHTRTHTCPTSLPITSGPGKKGLQERPHVNGWVSGAMMRVWARWGWWRGATGQR